MNRGKKYKEVIKNHINKTLSLDEGVEKISSLSTSKFEGKIEIHVSLNLNEKERKQPVRGTVVYKSPLGKPKKILVFCDSSKEDIAKKAGADFVGLDELIEKVKTGWTDFDVAIATPSVMSKLPVVGKVLGTKGLMPNPKSGTVTEDIKTAIESYRKGRVDYKSDETGVIHSLVGTVKTSSDELKMNSLTIIRSIIQNSGKPLGIALKSVYLTPTMGPSIKINKELLIKEI